MLDDSQLTASKAVLGTRSFAGGPIIERPVKPLLIIKPEAIAQATPGGVNGVMPVKIDILILHCPPETPF